LRIELPLLMVSGLPFAAAYAVVSWLCWVPNLVAAEMWLARARPRSFAVSAARAG
jgi:hypothetical protein